MEISANELGVTSKPCLSMSKRSDTYVKGRKAMTILLRRQELLAKTCLYTPPPP